MSKKEGLDDKVQKALSQICEDMLDDVIQFACKLAKHRKSRSIEKQDIKFAFERRIKMKVPTKMHGSTRDAIEKVATSH